MSRVDDGESCKVQDNKLNISSPGKKSGKIVDSELAMEIFFNLVFAIPIVIYRGFKFVLKKMRKTA